MVNRSKAKGTAFETEVVRYLQEHGFPLAERRALRGNLDCGDVSGIPGWVLEVKAEKVINLAGYMDEVRAETVNAGVPYGIAVVKRRMRPVSEAYAVMSLAQWVEGAA